MLKPNEKTVLDFIKKEAKSKGNPVNLSFSVIRDNVKYSRDAIITIKRKKIEWQPSRKGVNDTLLNLQKKGLITLDYSNRQKPKIVVNQF